MNLFVFRELKAVPWFKALLKLSKSKDTGKKNFSAYSKLFAELLMADMPDLATALATELLRVESNFAKIAMFKQNISDNLKSAVLYDLKELCKLINYPWYKRLPKNASQKTPSLKDIANQINESVLNQNIVSLRAVLINSDLQQAFEILLSTYCQHGTGVLAHHLAFSYLEEGLVGIKHPPKDLLEKLVGLEHQITQLLDNTEAFLAGKAALHTLLYGERGSGKSTAVRGLLSAYVDRGLRLVDVSPARLRGLNEVIESLRHRPHKYILFVDDLNFEADDKSYQPLKSLLEGSLIEPAQNILIYATSNRRHLVKELHSDRPDLLNDDIHAWDTFNEKLALADRFGLTITFPTSDQRRYLNIVKSLAAQRNLSSGDIEEQAIRFAQWGNGYTGRVAQQFLDYLELKTQDNTQLKSTAET